MSKESLIVQVSFKKKTRDIKLFTYVNVLEEKSDFVKDAIEFYIDHLNRGGCHAKPEQL